MESKIMRVDKGFYEALLRWRRQMAEQTGIREKDIKFPVVTKVMHRIMIDNNFSPKLKLQKKRKKPHSILLEEY